MERYEDQDATILEHKDSLRRDRDDWQEVIDYLEKDETDKAEEKAKKVLNRITESLQD